MENEFNELVGFLNEKNVDYEASTHQPVKTSEEAAAIRNVELKMGVKALVFTAGKRIVMVLVRGDKKADTKKLRLLFGESNIALASPDEVFKATNCELGSVHPFGNLFRLDTYMDKTIMENEFVNFSAGMHTKSIRMKAVDMANLINPKLADITKA